MAAAVLLLSGVYGIRHYRYFLSKAWHRLPHALKKIGVGQEKPGTRVPSPFLKGADWSFEISPEGELHIRYASVEVASFQYKFWGTDWSYAVTEVKPAATAEGALASFHARAPDLGLEMNMIVQDGAMADTLRFTYAVTTSRTLKHVIGGGLEFTLGLDSPVFSRSRPPELRDDKRGFAWKPADGATLTATFEPSLPELYLEPSSDKKVVRCFFLGSDAGADVPAASQSYTMTLQLPPQTKRRPSEPERYGGDPGPDWHPDTLDWNSWPIDVSFLSKDDRPAGKHGRVKARGEDLVYEDGSPARFWGTNLQATALFTGTKDAVARQAKRLAALGYNLVRICHHDSAWSSPNVFAPGDNTQKLEDSSLAGIDWWIKCLRDEGIYVWLDIKMEREFRPGDGIEGFAELKKAEPWGRGFDFVNPRLEELERQFAHQYLARVNQYTGVSYLDDPAILGALITNEDDLTAHFGNLMLPQQNNPTHTRMLRARVEEAVGPLKVSADEAMETWSLGAAKLVLADLEARYFLRSIADLRQLGFKPLIAGGNYWGDGDFYMLPSLTVGDMVDAHAYGRLESLTANPHIEPNFVTYLAATSVGKPVTISEWNIEFPTRDRFVGPLYVASMADLQGWDAPMQYGYWQQPLQPPSNVDSWSSIYDPALTALMPAAAVMYRQQHVREAEKTYQLEVSKDELYSVGRGPRTSAALRTLAEQSKVVLHLPDVPELPWDGTAPAPLAAGKQAITVTDLDRDFLPPDQTFVASDTGELKRDWKRGVMTIDTPKSQAAFGFIGGAPIQLHDVVFDIKTPAASAVVTSLDGEPISRSRKMLLTVVSQAAASPEQRLPMLAQPVEGQVTVKTGVSLRLVPLSPRAFPNGHETLAPVAGARGQGGIAFQIPSQIGTHWFLLQP